MILRPQQSAGMRPLQEVRGDCPPRRRRPRRQCRAEQYQKSLKSCGGRCRLAYFKGAAGSRHFSYTCRLGCESSVGTVTRFAVDACTGAGEAFRVPRHSIIAITGSAIPSHATQRAMNPKASDRLGNLRGKSDRRRFRLRKIASRGQLPDRISTLEAPREAGKHLFKHSNANRCVASSSSSSPTVHEDGSASYKVKEWPLLYLVLHCTGPLRKKSLNG